MNGYYLVRGVFSGAMVPTNLTDVRKIIKIGERSAGITIPKEWLPLLGLSIGSSVEVSLGSGYIMVRPLSITKTKPLYAVKVRAKDIETLSRLIIAGYIDGYDVIVVENSRDLARKAFYEVAMRLPGTIAMDGPSFTIKVSVDELNTKVEEVITSMKTTIDTMFDLLMDYFQTGDRSRLEQLIKLDDDLDRLHFLGVRTIKRTAFKNPQDALDNMIVIKSLEHIGDALDRASNTLLKLGSSFVEECKTRFRDVFARVAAYTSKSINSFVTMNLDLAIKVLMEREPLSREVFTIPGTCIDTPETMALVHEATVILYEAAEIAEVATARIVRYSEEKNIQVET